MNSYFMIRRLRGPAFLLLVGVLALLDQAGIIGWGRSWPFFLILAGVLKLAERGCWLREAAIRKPLIQASLIRPHPITGRLQIFQPTPANPVVHPTLSPRRSR